MTTIQNDAAVTAESAAKLVSELRSKMCKPCQIDGERYGEATGFCGRCRAYWEASTLIERHAAPQTQATHGEGEAVAHDMHLYPGSGISVCTKCGASGVGAKNKPCVPRADADCNWPDCGFDTNQSMPNSSCCKTIKHPAPSPTETDFQKHVRNVAAFNEIAEPYPAPSPTPALGELAKAYGQWCFSALDPRKEPVLLDGRRVPLLTVMLYSVCENDAHKFELANELLCAAYIAGASALSGVAKK